MLVLTRKKSEAIRIGNDVFVKVIRTGRSTVKIGIEAPANVRVVRGELVIMGGTETAVLTSDEAETHEDACSDQFPQTHIVSPSGV
jgi:carbon storage regulator